MCSLARNLRMKISLTVCWGLVFLATSNNAFSAEVLRSQTEVKGRAIRLSDVFDGLTPGIDREIAIAPQPGRSVVYDVNVLNKLAQQYRLDWQPQSVNDKSTLKRASSRITPDMLHDAVVEKLKKSTEALKDCQVDASLDNKNLEIHLPVDQSTQFVLKNFVYESENQRFHADLVAGNSEAPVVQSFSGRVSVKRDVPVLAHHLEAGTVVSDADLGWVTLPVDHLANDILMSTYDLVGREMRHDMGENVPLRARDVMQPRLVTRGSLVTMKIETSVLKITAQGRAMQDGALGDNVRITNTQSNRVVEGRVTASGVVTIHVPEMTTFQQAAAEPAALRR